MCEIFLNFQGNASKSTKKSRVGFHELSCIDSVHLE